MNRRIHVYYNGRVQGVGFRFTAERLAVDLGLTGWVKNMPDGRVELVCEGQEQKLHTILDKIASKGIESLTKKEKQFLENYNYER